MRLCGVTEVNARALQVPRARVHRRGAEPDHRGQETAAGLGQDLAEMWALLLHHVTAEHRQRLCELGPRPRDQVNHAYHAYPERTMRCMVMFSGLTR